MRVGLAQYDIRWLEPHRNFQRLEQLIRGREKEMDLLVLPEMFNTGFSTWQTVNTDWQDDAIRWMKDISEKYSMGVMGSIPYHEAGKWFNRMLFFDEKAVSHVYDKRHLFALGDEAKLYSPGTARKVFKYKNVRWCPMICYDLRFPVWSRNNEDYDVLVYVANWPASRIHAWDVLLRARAIENQCYVLGLNRIGVDGQDVPYCGHSVVIAPSGDVLHSLKPHEEALMETEIDINLLARFRQRYPFLRDRDSFRMSM